MAVYGRSAEDAARISRAVKRIEAIPVETPAARRGPRGGSGGGAAPQCGQTIEIDNRGGLAVRLVSADCTTPWSVIPAQSCVGSLVSVPT